MSSSGGKIVGYSLVGFFGGIILFVHGLSAFRLKRLIENTPTSKVRSAAVGLVEVFGVAVPCEGKLSSPFSKKDCVYYKYSIEEYRHSGKSSRWVTLKSGECRSQFYVEDDTGKILVNPNEARIEIPIDSEYNSGNGNDPPECVLEFLSQNGISHEGFFGWNKRMRFREYFIEPGDSIYVMGIADISQDSAGSANGSENLMIHKGANNKTFYISDQPEKKILSELGGKILWGVFGGAVLSVGCLAIIMMYFGWI